MVKAHIHFFYRGKGEEKLEILKVVPSSHLSQYEYSTPSVRLLRGYHPILVTRIS